MADVVVHVVADRLPAGPALAAVVRGDGHAELDHLGPERVVVVLAVDAVEVDVADLLGDLGVLGGGVLLGNGTNRPAHAAGDVDHLQAQRLDRELQLLDAFLRRVQRNARHRCQAVGIGAVLVGMEVVDGAVQWLAVFAAGRGGREHIVGEQDRVVRALLTQALVQQRGQRVGGQVVGVARHAGPPGRAQRAVELALFGALLVPVLAAAVACDEAAAQGLAQCIDELAAAVVLHVVFEHGGEVVDVDIRVDHGMVEAGFHGGGARCVHAVQSIVHLRGSLGGGRNAAGYAPPSRLPKKAFGNA
jgi:hypothetical protein